MFGEQFHQHHVRGLAVEDDDALDAIFQRFEAGLDLGDHAAGNRALGHQLLGFAHAEFGNELLVGIEHAVDIGEEQQPLGAERAGNGASKGIGVDIVGRSIPAGRHRGYHRDHFRAGEEIEQRPVDFDRFTDKPQIEHALDVRIGIDDGLVRLARKNHVAVLAAKPDRPLALGIDQRHDLFVDRAGEHHLDDFHGPGVGDAEPAFELALDAEVFQHRGDLRPAAVHDDRVDLGLLEQRDIAGKRLPQAGVAHGVATVFHHDGLALIALHIGQRLGKDRGVTRKGRGIGHGAFGIHEGIPYSGFRGQGNRFWCHN